MALPALLLTALLALAPPGQDVPPSPERVREVAAQLARAFESRKPPEKVAAIRAATEVVAPAVIAGIAKGLGDSSWEVRVAAIDALGLMPHDDAWKALTSHYRAQWKNLRKEERLLPRLLRAIARHGREAGIAILVDDVQAQMLQPTLRARILGLANIRSTKSVDALLALTQTIGFIDMHDHAEDFRLAMRVLTGEDKGRSVEAWRAWWSEQREGFELPSTAPALAPADAQRWADFWGGRSEDLERR